MAKVSFKDVYEGFLERGLKLDITENEYIDQYTKIKCHCVKHPNTDLYYAWQYVKIGRFSCVECNKENSKFHKIPSIEERIKYINENSHFTYVSGMTKRNTEPIIVKCNKGHDFSTNFNLLKKEEVICPFCANKPPSSYWSIKTCQEWLDNNDIKYKVLDFTSLSNHNKVYIHCGNANHKPYWASWAHIQNGTRCKECYYIKNNKINWTLDKVKELISKFSMEMIDESLYTSSHKRIPCKDIDGFIYMVSVNYLTRGRDSFSLWKENPYAVHNIKLFCKLYRPDYELLSNKYYGNNGIHLWRYNGDFYDNKEHVREFNMTFAQVINSGCRHPDIHKSQLELECIRILKKHNIDYVEQKTFDECKHKNKLRFDFYLCDYDICIETDGLQHSIPVDIWGGLQGLQDIVTRDNIKNEYCKTNNIKLIRIPQKKINKMEEIILNELTALNIKL